MNVITQTKDRVINKTRELLAQRTDASKGYHVALDIGTEVVKALIFSVDDAGKAHVWGVGRERQRLSDMQNGAVSDIAGVVENTEKALAVAEAMAGNSPKDAILGIAGELVKGTVKKIEFKRRDPRQKISVEELDRIMNQVEIEAAKAARAEIVAQTGLQGIELKLVNAAVVDVKIDGYKVTNPIGFQGSDVTVSIYNAFAPLVHIGALETVAHELGLAVLSIAAEPYAVARSVSTAAAQDFSAIFIDIGGGTTDIAPVIGGGLTGTEMFAIGGRSFTKRLSHMMNTTFAQAEQMKLDYSAERLDPETQSKIGHLYGEDIQVWLSGVELALEQFKNVELLPSQILLTGGGSLLPEVKLALESSWWQQSKFARQPSVEWLSPDAVTEVEDHTGELHDPRDMTAVGLVNLARTFSAQDSLLNEVLKKVTKTLEV